jgi:glycosyltransferase involved in cell wall biosynthesis
MIGAVALLREKAPNLRCWIIGDGPDFEKLKAMVEKEQLEDRVTMNGAVSIDKVAETMAFVDLGVVPKRSDSFGNEAFSTKIMEFMAMGVPVLASRTAIDQYYFTDQLVQFFESDNVRDLADKILDLMSDSSRRDSLRTHGAEFIRQNNWGVRKQEYLDLVDHLVKPSSYRAAVAKEAQG